MNITPCDSQNFSALKLNPKLELLLSPDMELNHGYCDFILLPNLTQYSTKHSYIIELKMLSKSYFVETSKKGKLTKAEAQWQEAVEQINGYAVAPQGRGAAAGHYTAENHHEV